MGVYVFRVKNTRCVKIGSTTEISPWQRVAFRGFANVLLPDEINTIADYRNLELLYWINDFNIRDERFFHRIFARHHIFGEWFDYTTLSTDPYFKKHIVDKSNIENVKQEDFEKQIQQEIYNSKRQIIEDFPMNEPFILEYFDINNIIDRVNRSIWCGNIRK